MSTGDTRLVLNPSAMADLVVSHDETGLRVSGLFLKRYNDVVPINCFNGIEITADTFKTAVNTTNGFLYLGPDYNVPAKLLSLKFSALDRMVILNVPELGTEFTTNYVNLTVKRCGPGPIQVLALRESAAAMHWRDGVSDEEEGGRIQELGEVTHLSISPGASCGFTCRSEAYYFNVTPRCICCVPNNIAISIRHLDGNISLFIEDSEFEHATFSIFMHPLHGRRLLAGHETIGLHSASLVLAVHAPFPPRAFHWVACAIVDQTDIPLACPSHYPPHLSFPHLLIGQDGGWFVANRKAMHNLLNSVDRVVLLGNVPSQLLLDIIKGMAPKVLAIVADDAAYIQSTIKTLSIPIVADTSINPIWYEHQGCRVGFLCLDDLPKDLPMIEDFIIEATRSFPVHIEIAEIQKIHLKNRLPALPHCADLVIGMIAIFGSTQRGRVVADDGAMQPRYDCYANDKLWLFPWNREVKSRGDLIVELNLRLAAEYLAVQSFVAAGLECGTETPAISFRDVCRDYFDLWRHKISIQSTVYESALSALRNFVEDQRIAARAILSELAALAYEACSRIGQYNQEDPWDNGDSYANPLVLVLAGGGPDSFDWMLSLDAAYWAAYAARIAGRLPTAIAPTLLQAEEIETLRCSLSELRLTAYGEPLDVYALYERRISMGQCLLNSLDQSAIQLLENLAPSRVVSFSDIPLDLLPFRHSVLGLEVPLARFPGYAASAVIANTVLATNHTLRRLEGDISAIISAPNVDDPVNRWVSEITPQLEKSLELFGGRVRFPVREKHSANELLKVIERIPILFFLGHAKASLHWAGLNAGDFYITAEQIEQMDWTHSFVFLLGCETAAADTKEGDLAASFMRGGARAVIGSLARVHYTIASVFFSECFVQLQNGVPADYAFFMARRKAVMFEAINIIRGNDVAHEFLQQSKTNDSPLRHRTMKEILQDTGLSWAEVMQNSPNALSFTLVGGVGERLL